MMGNKHAVEYDKNRKKLLKTSWWKKLYDIFQKVLQKLYIVPPPHSKKKK